MNKTPEIINVLGIPYRVEKPDRITVDGVNGDGSVTYNTSLIEIVDGMPVEVERVVLFHELMHAVFKAQGQTKYRKDENLLDAIAHGIVEVLRANPQLVAYTIA